MTTCSTTIANILLRRPSGRLQHLNISHKQQMQNCDRGRRAVHWRCGDILLTTTSFQLCAGLFVLFNLLEAVPIGSVRKRTVPSETIREDTLCNLGDEHECVCNRSSGSLDHVQRPCHEFLEVKNVDVVTMVLRDINLSTRLHTNETYEQYLRRRIAHILSQYCENMPDDCPGTLADIRSQRKKTPVIEIDEKTMEILYDEPVFSRGNIVILRITYPAGKSRTELEFVVTKRSHTIAISPETVLDPITVKYILSAQIVPLSRVLGGIRIVQFGVTTLEKPMEPVDNTKLLIMIGVITFSMFICCTIAAIRQFSLFREARAQTRQNKATITEKKSTRNYGTCTDKFFSNYDFPNGNAKTKSLCSRDSGSSKKKSSKKEKKKSKCCENDVSTAAAAAVERTPTEEEISSSPRPFQNIFVCDHSQLPKEDVDEEFEMEIQRVKRHSLNVRSPRSPFSSDEDAFAFHGFHFPDRPSSNEKRLSISENIPAVVLDEDLSNENSPKIVNDMGGVGPSSQHHSQHQFPNDTAVLKANNNGGGGAGLLSAISEDHPFERPLSRRGSINDGPQEEGEEEACETREDTPVPLGDEGGAPVVEKPLIDVLRMKNKKRIAKIVIQQSDSEEEEDGEENVLYQPLKEEERKKFKPSAAESSSESENEEEDSKKECNMLERHQYERLLESPLLPSDSSTNVNNSISAPKIILND